MFFIMKSVGYGSLRDLDSIRYDLFMGNMGNDKMTQIVYFVDVFKKKHVINLDEKSRKWIMEGNKIWVFLEKKGELGIYIDLL